MDDAIGTVTDRRRVLATGLAVLGGAAGLSLAGGGQAAAAGTRVVRLTADQVTGQIAGRQLDEAAAIGDTIITSGRLINSQGIGTGRYSSVATLLAIGTRFDRPAVATMQQHVLVLPGGTLIGSGTANADGAGVFAILGGTGSYNGFRGSYTTVQSVAGLGGNGTARFVLTLIG